MALYDRVQSEMVEARVKRIDDDLVVRVARKEVKRRKEAIDVYRKAGREDSARREEAEMEILRGFLPASMSEEQVEAEVRAVIAEVKPEGPKGFGLVMKAATARLAGRADGNDIAKVTRRLLG